MEQAEVAGQATAKDQDQDQATAKAKDQEQAKVEEQVAVLDFQLQKLNQINAIVIYHQSNQLLVVYKYQVFQSEHYLYITIHIYLGLI